MPPSALRARAAALTLVVLSAAGIVACGASQESAPLGTARWGQYAVAVETRPWPPREGNNEVVVIISGERHQPVYDAVVSIRAQAGAAWVQAIEDGHVGVYRRAVNFGHGGDTTLEVQLRRGDEQAVLAFPVALPAPR